MSTFSLKSSNPVLNDQDTFNAWYGEMAGTRPETATVQGVVNKTGLLVSIAVLAGGLGYWLLDLTQSFSIITISAIAAFVTVLGVGFVLRGDPAKARFLAPVYAIVEGVFLGSLSAALDTMLANLGYAVMGGVALQAFIITLCIAISMLVLYTARIIRPSRTFVAVVSVATMGIMLTYVVSFVLSLFGTPLPFVSLNSAFGSGWTPLIGLGINLLVLGVASMWLIIDFKMVEDLVESGAPRSHEWYCGFALLVTLAWVYFEAVKLVFRIAILLGSRE